MSATKQPTSDLKTVDPRVQTFTKMTKMMLERARQHPKSHQAVMVLDKCQVMLEYVLSLLDANVFDLQEPTTTALQQSLQQWYKALALVSEHFIQNEPPHATGYDSNPPPVCEELSSSDDEEVVPVVVKRSKRRGRPSRVDYQPPSAKPSIPTPPELPHHFARRMASSMSVSDAVDPDWFSSGDPVPDDHAYGSLQTSQSARREARRHHYDGAYSANIR